MNIHSDVNARNCTNTVQSAGVQLRRGHMILDHYGFLIKLQKMKRSITGKSSSKNVKVSYVQVAIAASLLEHRTRVFRRRLSAVELRKESQRTRLSGYVGLRHTTLGNPSLTLLAMKEWSLRLRRFRKKIMTRSHQRN